eukprot:15206843-Alexandrium_andersonii.AAC.1
MSASLVGSEMCIRDRRRGHQGRDRAWAGAVHQGCGHHQPDAWRLLRYGCLLYTSDAADDM